MKSKKPLTFGLIVGTRGFFPSHLCEEGRRVMIDVLRKHGIRVVAVPENSTAKFGAIESIPEAKACAELFRRNAGKIDGIVVTLPNFGDERAVSNAIRWSGLNVPVLVHAWPDDLAKLTVADRRDSFCGKMSCCNNLRQYGIRYSLTSGHTMDPRGAAFSGDLESFAAVCRIVRALRNVRIGVVGARPAPFTTVRYSEKLLEKAGVSVETLDLSELLGNAKRLKANDPALKEKLEALKAYVPTGVTPADALERMARFGAALDAWREQCDLSATTVQCWTSLEDNYGIVPCAVMSMLSESLSPSACECDVGGLIGMLALQEALETPASILDWNNNYGDDPDKGVLFHCSNLPKSCFDSPCMSYQAIIAGTVGRQNACGTVCGRIKPGPFTFLRVDTDDETGSIRGYTGEGEFTDDPISTFGGYGVFRVPHLQALLNYICRNGFEHHVSTAFGNCSEAVAEALGNYLGWDIAVHSCDCCG